MAVIEVRGLTKRFGPVLAVDQLSFGVDRGTVVGFLGPNGAGRTTTLRALLGLVRPTGGTATIDGKPYAELGDPARHVGAVLGASSFYPGRRARGHLRVQAMAVASTRPGSRRCSSSSGSKRRPGGGSAGSPSGCVSVLASPPRCSAIRPS